MGCFFNNVTSNIFGYILPRTASKLLNNLIMFEQFIPLQQICSFKPGVSKLSSECQILKCENAKGPTVPPDIFFNHKRSISN